MIEHLFVYRIAAMGAAIILLTVLGTLAWGVTIGTWQAVLLIFSGVMVITPLVSKFTLNREGFVLETAKALDQTQQAIKTINDKVTELSAIVKDLQLAVQHRAADNGKAEGVVEFSTAIGDRLATLQGELHANSAVIEQSAARTRTIKDLLENKSGTVL